MPHGFFPTTAVNEAEDHRLTFFWRFGVLDRSVCWDMLTF
jgi:hypothetical protein